ncbi:MAG TPA: hypothetical protein VN721_17540 [Flavipsychrobacter sp.]|nr:hypothetical protein [Flavipsychrobacter sp.]
MNKYVNIIESNILGESWDSFWADIDNIVIEGSLKPVLILTKKYESSAEEIQLQKMLQACNLVAEQYNILQLQEQQLVAWHQIKEKLSPKFILLIGTSPSQLGISALFKLNEFNHFSDCIWIPTLSLKEWETQPETKKQLWTGGLKPIFIEKSFGNI